MATRIRHGQILSISTAVILLINVCALGAVFGVHLGPVARGSACTTVTRDRIQVTGPIPGNSRSHHAACQKLANLPLWFEPNRGQAEPTVRFLSQGRGYALFITQTDTILSLYQTGYQTKPSGSATLGGQSGPCQDSSGRPQQAARGASISIRLAGSNPTSRVEGLSKLSGRASYFIGSDPSSWHADIPTFARVRRNQVYRGIDAVYYGNE